MLNQDTYNQIVKLLKNNNLTGSTAQRRALINAAFYGYDDIIDNIELEGESKHVIVTNMVRYLSDYGSIKDGTPALWVLLKHIRDNEAVGNETEAEINRLKSVFMSSNPVEPNPPTRVAAESSNENKSSGLPPVVWVAIITSTLGLIGVIVAAIISRPEPASAVLLTENAINRENTAIVRTETAEAQAISTTVVPTSEPSETPHPTLTDTPIPTLASVDTATDIAQPTSTPVPPSPTATHTSVTREYPCEGQIAGVSGLLNQVRLQPRPNSPLTNPVQQGSTVTITNGVSDFGSFWYQIQYNQNQGWIDEEYVEPSAQCPIIES